ncbi:MAG: hypothetical protein ACXWVO_08050 [Caulobacteraceae bacterium]
MTEAQLKKLKAEAAARSAERMNTPGASRKFMISAGIYNQKGKLKASFLPNAKAKKG